MAASKPLRLRDQITSRAKTCSSCFCGFRTHFHHCVLQCRNLILSRSVRREGELAIRAALGASGSALRRTLLAESLLLCVAGALLGVLSAGPMVSILARYASRFSVRAQDLTVDSSMLVVRRRAGPSSRPCFWRMFHGYLRRSPRKAWAWQTAACASPAAPVAPSHVRGHADRRLVRAAGRRQYADQDAALATIRSDGFDMHRVLALNLPVMSYGKTPDQIINFYRETCGASTNCPASITSLWAPATPWRDAGGFGPGFGFTGEGHVKGVKEEDPRAQFRAISPGFFAFAGRADCRRTRLQRQRSPWRRACGDR